MENVEGQQPEVNQPAAEGPSLEELQQQIEKLSSYNEKLLSESKHHAEKYKKLRDSVEGEKKAELEKSENWKELLEKERDEKFQLSQSLEKTRERALEKSLKFEVAKYANDAHKIERVIGAVLDSDHVQVNEDRTEFQGVKEAIEALRNDEPYLFKIDKPAGMVNANPGTKAPQAKTVAEMNKSERDALLKESIKTVLTNKRS